MKKLHSLITAVLAVFCCTSLLPGDELEEALVAVSSVAPEGKGHEAAMAAWKTLASADAGKLATLLSGIKEGSPLGNNWIRSAVETVASRSIAQTGKLPVRDLEAFLMDRAGDARARRLAYELILRVDKGAEDRLIPKMLNDPNVELRRDAVAKVLDQATKQLESDKAAAKATYAKALASARDQDQIDEAAKQLAELGEEVDLNEHFGFLLSWHVIGPFDNVNKGGFNVAYPPEETVNLETSHKGKEGKVAWINHTSDDAYGKVDLNDAIAKHMGAAGYAYTIFESDKEQEVDFRLTSKNANKFWLNGELLDENEVYHAGSELDQYTCRGRLKKGPNTLLLKICQNEQEESWAQEWQFQFRVCDKVGTAILSADRK